MREVLGSNLCASKVALTLIWYEKLIFEGVRVKSLLRNGGGLGKMLFGCSHVLILGQGNPTDIDSIEKGLFTP